MKIRVTMLLAAVAGTMMLSGQTTGDNRVIAELSGRKLTLGELEQAMADRLFQARQQYYSAERAALEQWIDDQVVAEEARSEKLTVDELLERTIHVNDPTDDQLRVYFEGLNTDQSFESVRDKILQHIRELRRAKIRTAYVASLREKAGVHITFDPPAVDLSSNAPILGPKNAPIQVVEFADYECPYCQQAYPVIQKLRETYGSKMSFSFRDYPLPMHPDAPKAAEAARCAGVQGKYWEYHDSLFKDKKLAVPDLKDEARKLSLDTTSFDKCLDSGIQAEQVKNDSSEAQRLQLTGTPTFFINGHLYSGAVNLNELQKAIDKESGVTASSDSSTAQAPR